MDIQRYGIILNVENYDECVSFYRDLFELVGSIRTLAVTLSANVVSTLQPMPFRE